MSAPKIHPLTGHPILPVYIDRHGRLRYPFIGAAEGDDAGTEQGDKEETFDYPAETPIADMKPDQQVEYWREKAQKHERLLRAERTALGGIKPEQLTALREKAQRQDALEQELASETEKAVTAAKQTTQQEADDKYRPLLAETAFRVAIGDRKTAEETNDFLADLNLTRFIKDDGQVDTAKVLSRVEQFAPAKGNQQQRGPVVTGHGSGNSGNGRSSGGSVAQVMADRAAARAAKN